jgi:hypothetical protein
MRGSWPIEFPSIRSTQKHNKSIYYLFLPFFPLYLFSSFFIGAAWFEDWWQQCSRAVRLARAAHSRRTPRRGPSRACGVLGLKRPRRCILRIALITGGIRSRCGHPLGAGRSLNRLGHTLSDLAPYRVCDLIKRQHTFWWLHWERLVRLSHITDLSDLAYSLVPIYIFCVLITVA